MQNLHLKEVRAFYEDADHCNIKVQTKSESVHLSMLRIHVIKSENDLELKYPFGIQLNRLSKF